MTEHIIRPPFDSECDFALEPMKSLMAPVALADIPQLRVSDAIPKFTDEDLTNAGIQRRDYSVRGYLGDSIEVTVLSRKDHDGVGPGIYYTHGGGMIAGNRMTCVDDLFDHITNLNAVVVTVEYRLAPEFPDPYPVEDCYAGLIWTAEHAHMLGIDPRRLMIAGTSAGGGLAAGCALLARDRQGPPLIGQLLVCPMLDDRDGTVSASQYPDEGTWLRGSNVTGWTALLGERRGGPDVSIYAAPARAEDLRGLPPTFVDCGSAEVFRDEDVAYALKLWEHGVAAELHVWAGGYHGFDMIAPTSQVGQAAISTRRNWVRRLLDQ